MQVLEVQVADREIISSRALIAAALLGWLAIAVIGLVTQHPLGHDEAAYAVAARANRDVWLYRSDGMIAIAELGLFLGGERAEGILRLPAALLSLAALAATYAAIRAACSPRTAAWTVALLAGAHPLVLRNAELLSDLPAMAGILAGMALLVSELPRPGGPRWRLLWAAPLWAAAFYVRYGSAPTIAIVFALALVRWRRAAWQRPAPVAATLALLAALLVPHLLRALATTGSPLGIVAMSAEIANRAYVGDGLVEYLTTNPLRTFGVLVAPVMIGGLALQARQARRARQARSGAPADRPAARGYLVAVALAQILALGLQCHGEPRYLYVATALLAAVGVDHLRALAARRAAPCLPLGALAATALALTLLLTLAFAPSHFRSLAERRAAIVAAAAALAEQAAGQPCVTSARPVPQLSWYSGCAVATRSATAAPRPPSPQTTMR